MSLESLFIYKCSFFHFECHSFFWRKLGQLSCGLSHISIWLATSSFCLFKNSVILLIVCNLELRFWLHLFWWVRGCSDWGPVHPLRLHQKVLSAMLSLEKAMAPHSSTLAWKIPWTEEPGRLQSMGLLRVRHDWATSLSLFTFMHWRRKWQTTPVFLPGESQGRGSLVGCRLWGRTESNMTEAT